MRKHHQDQILDLLKTISAAQKAGLYGDCQDGALSLCDFIDSLKGEGTETAALLLEYCELLYKTSRGELKWKHLSRHLNRVENGVKSELVPDATEVVFINYKASMSDSLESVYLAAKEDPACTAVWLPVPYMEYNPDRSIRATVYEGAEFYPDYIECTDWEHYDIETIRPDAVFINNPYDEYNNVTCVHPLFHAKRLKDLTGMLVYIPYFVVLNGVAEHFATAMGCVYAHKVIVQSEKVRESYVKHFKEAYGNQYGRAEDKFIALGSPKFDKVLNTKREDCELPDEWRRMIEKPDGTLKKIVLYNIRFTDMSEGIENQLAKLRQVIETFKNQDDVVLWWRPHPLNEACLRAMRPQYLLEYEEILAEQRPLGIFDSTPNVHRAIAWSDAYYGDNSSVEILYRLTDKPIIIQNISETENKDVLLRFADFSFDKEGNAWAFELFNDALFKINFDHNTAELISKSGSVPRYKGKPIQTCRYIFMHCSEDEVICFPYGINNIFFYNHKKKTFKKHQLEHNYMLPNSFVEGFVFSSLVLYQEELYAFGHFSKAIVVFNLQSQDVNYETKLFDCIGLLTNDKEFVKYPIYMSECSPCGKIIMLMRNCEYLIRYSLPTQEIEFISSNPMLANCTYADFDDENYWLVYEGNQKIIKWNPFSNLISEFLFSSDGFYFSSGDYVISGISNFEKYLLIFPGTGDMILKFDKSTEKFSKYIDMPVLDGIDYKYNRAKKINGKIYAFYRTVPTVYEIDEQNMEIVPHQFKLREHDYNMYFDYKNVSNKIYESNLLKIAKNTAHYIRCVLNEKAASVSSAHNNSLENSSENYINSGVEIYKYLRIEVGR